MPRGIYKLNKIIYHLTFFREKICKNRQIKNTLIGVFLFGYSLFANSLRYLVNSDPISLCLRATSTQA